MFTFSRRNRNAVNVWPAFVDALASILLVFVFLVLLFVLGQSVLSGALAGRDKALEELSRQVSALAETLSLERTRSQDLSAQLQALSEQLRATLAERDQTSAALRAERARAADLSAQIAAAQSALAGSRESLSRLETEAAQLRERSAALGAQADAERAKSSTYSEQIAMLNQQVTALREQLARLAAALEASEAKERAQRTQIDDLGRRLNVALARRVEELARYRSEFFGRLREVLGNDPNIRIVGDRFVFQSELLFPSASDELSTEGMAQLTRLAQTLNALTRKIPDDLPWVLSIDGHTDRRPISNQRYPSNWELSSARALSVVKHLITQGVPPQRLVATGYGEFHPIDPARTSAAYERNRRIEIKLTQP